MKIQQTTKNRGGFTFAELLVAGAAASFLVSVFLPSVTDAMDELAVRSAAEQFMGAHQRARAAAIHYGRTAQVRLDPEELRIWVEVDTTSARTGEPTVIGDVVDLTESEVAVDAETGSVCFDSRGLARTRGACAAAGSTFSFSRGISTLTVTTTATGFLPQ